ncbi:MAG: hypothetical protein AB7P04_14360 [Bacteriovoracia bacterium]
MDIQNDKKYWSVEINGREVRIARPKSVPEFCPRAVTEEDAPEHVTFLEVEYIAD